VGLGVTDQNCVAEARPSLAIADRSVAIPIATADPERMIASAANRSSEVQEADNRSVAEALVW
jgi:hypothetical protein